MATLATDHQYVANDLKHTKFVYIHCVEDGQILIRMTNFPAIVARVRLCHISFPNMPIIRSAVIADTWGDGHVNFPVPKLLELKSSCEVEWAGDSGQQFQGVCVWRWDEMGDFPAGVQAKSCSGSSLGLLQPVKDGDCQYCCDSKETVVNSSDDSSNDSSNDSSVAEAEEEEEEEDDDVETTTKEEDDDSDDDIDEQELDSTGTSESENEHEVEDEDEEKLFPFVVKLRGSTMEERYQVVLNEVEVKLDDNIPVPVRILAEPDNPVDVNAYRVDAQIDNQWKIIGYIPRQMIRKFKSAMDRSEIISSKLLRVVFLYHPVRNGLFPIIVVLKKKKNGCQMTTPTSIMTFYQIFDNFVFDKFVNFHPCYMEKQWQDRQELHNKYNFSPGSLS
ncbi:uncharacterized protein [Amphiura filiformis]|uniref:uncharacterized protein n=1 Tax=Amphiura filiformis TaxID=82378 RepID=UPI003B20C225